MTFERAASVFVAALLVAAAAGKVANPHKLRRALAELRIVSSTAVVWFVVVAEIALSILILVGNRVGGALSVAFGGALILLGAFGLRRGASEPCGCFGASSAEAAIGWRTILYGSGFSLVGLIVWHSTALRTATEFRNAAATTSLTALALTAFLNRRIMQNHLGPAWAALRGY